MTDRELERLKGDFKQLGVKDEANRNRMLNEFETVVRRLLPSEAGRYVKQARKISFYPIAYVVPGPDHTPETWRQGKAEMVALIESVEHHVSLLRSTAESERKTTRGAQLTSALTHLVAFAAGLTLATAVTRHVWWLWVVTALLAVVYVMGLRLIPRWKGGLQIVAQYCEIGAFIIAVATFIWVVSHTSAH